ncbi:MAG TPA: DUF1223 domain-containing protein [Dongiaceae bacterium]|nr:DUF1223 domain-containing protein [Dongiaceae bacterium]
MKSSSQIPIDQRYAKAAARLSAVLGAATLTLLMLSAAAQAASRPVVVELFTSQGCSSCPPADALLGELAQRSNVIALGFHVDYWDNLGWKDPLSAPGSTRRQRDYAQLLNLPTIYTPQMVIEGRLDVVGSNRSAVLDGIDRAAPESAASIAFSDDRHAVTIGSGSGSGKVLLVRFLRQRQTTVARGENAGREARDANGVTAISELGRWQGQELHFPIAPPSDDEGVAVLLQRDDGHMLGAASVL